MADSQRICVVDGCGKRHSSQGYCPAHAYKFKKYGDPLAGKTKVGNGAVLKWMAENKEHRGDDCLIWPFALGRGGYGNVWDGARYTNAHRLMCVMVHGEPDREMQAAHSCGNRACVNPEHLRWASPAENNGDKVAHGTTRRGMRSNLARLSPVDVIGLRLFAQAHGAKQAAREFRVSNAHAYELVAGRNWSWL